MACGWGCSDPMVDGSPQPAGLVVFFFAVSFDDKNEHFFLF
jgi:hypothetical protein